MAYNATFKIKLAGKIVEISYQDIIKKLDAGNLVAEGAPLSEGGTPQMLLMKQLLEKRMVAPNGEHATVGVYLHGNQIL